MRVAISNIAWDAEEDDLIAELFSQYGIDAIDVALGKYSLNPINASDNDIIKLRNYWAERGVTITALQSLLFGTHGLNVFGTSIVKDRLLDYLSKICQIANKLGASCLVFGSPKNRDRTGLSDSQAADEAIKFFRRLGDIAQTYNVITCLEPNPECYGANFMTSSLDTLAIVKQVDHPAIRMQLDTGAIFLNKEPIKLVLDAAQPYIGHIHVSEPNLLTLGASGMDHEYFANHIKNECKLKLVTIEMLASKNVPNLLSIERALKLVTSIYRDK